LDRAAPTTMQKVDQPAPPYTPPVRSLLRRAAKEPRRAMKAGLALLKGFLYKAYYRVRGRRFRAGSNLRVFGSLSVRGPGEVVFGENVTVYGETKPWTYAPDARIVVGDKVILGGTQFGCALHISIGARSILGQCSMMDTDFHSTRADRWSKDAPVRVAAIRIGTNVWIGQNAGILPGTEIGDNSVVSFGAVCMRSFPANVVIVGNPAKVAAPIPASPSA
jgi:carbonic anhydrase/acetyltransferase-like protein (isoleucine patch superfamily)